MLPAPRYVVFYNGLERQEEEFAQYLSESFADKDGCIEVTECISEDILRDFLMEQRNEVVAMSIYEYNEAYAMRVSYEDGESAGYERGRKEGKAEGREQALIHNIEAAVKNFGISLEGACAGLDVSMEEYQRAKAQMMQ